MTTPTLLLAQAERFLPAKMDPQVFLTRIGLGAVLAGVFLLIFYAVGRSLSERGSGRVRGRSSSKKVAPETSSSSPSEESHRSHHHRRRRRHAAGHRNPTLKDAGGLPPLRPEGTPPAE